MAAETGRRLAPIPGKISCVSVNMLWVALQGQNAHDFNDLGRRAHLVFGDLSP